MAQEREAKSLMDYLRTVPDPRRRQGRRYPLKSILAMPILAALQGHSYLRRMWVWAKAHEEKLLWPLGLRPAGRLSALGTVWELLSKLDEEAFAEAMSAWTVEWGLTEALSVDGKCLRGSKREGKEALRVVTAAAQGVSAVLQQTGSESDDLEAAIRVLKALPLEGQVVSLDAGLLQRRVIKIVVAKKGAISAC